jgi:hypothetical protein
MASRGPLLLNCTDSRPPDNKAMQLAAPQVEARPLRRTLLTP